MPAMREERPVAEERLGVNANDPCHGYCSGYGTRYCCPPLIVLAMHAQHLPDHACHEEQVTERGDQERVNYFTRGLTSGEFCRRTLSFHCEQSAVKMEM